MSTKIFIRNLPAGTTVDEIKELLTQRGWPLLGLEKLEESSSDHVTFVAETDVEPKTARLMADRARDHYFKGRKVRIYVPLPTD